MTGATSPRQAVIIVKRVTRVLAAAFPTGGLRAALNSPAGNCLRLLLATACLGTLSSPASGQTLSQSPAAFGGVQIYTTFQIVDTLTNTSNNQFNLGEVDLSGTNSTSFALVPGSNQCTSNLVLQVGDSCNFYINFSPTNTQAYSALLDIEDLDSAVQLSGTGIYFYEDVGTTQAAQSVTVLIANGGTPATISALSSGNSGQDFITASGGTCDTDTTYNAGDLCTVGVAFAPQFPGTLNGAILLTDSSGNILGTTFLNGYGNSPEIIFSPVTPTVLIGYITGLAGIAIDAQDDIFYVDGHGNITEVTPASQSTVIGSVGNGTTVTSMALDGAGDLFLSLSGSEALIAELPSTGPGTWGNIIGLDPSGIESADQIAVDYEGNLYVLDHIHGTFQMPWTASGFATPVKLPFPSVNSYIYDGITVDGSLDVAAIAQNVSTGQTQMVFLPAGNSGYGTPTTTTIAPIAAGASLAFDGNGDLYVSGLINSTNGSIYFAPNLGFGTYGTPTQVSIGLYYNFALDGAGNIFAVEANLSDQAQIVKIPQATPPSLTFATTAVGSTSTDSPQNVTVWNVGTDTLYFNSVGYPADFPQDSGGTNQCNTEIPVEPSLSCNVTIDFTPTVPGNLAEDVTLVDDALNGVKATQNIAVNATATQSSSAATLTSIAFGNQTVGTTSAPMAATLSDSSSDEMIAPAANTRGRKVMAAVVRSQAVPLNNIQISFIGTNPADFAVTTGSNACGTTLAADSSCSIWVTFAPSIVGAESAELYVSDDASNSPQISQLSGTGVAAAAPAAKLSPSIAFGNETMGSTSAAMTATLSNTGNATLNISGITISGANASDFAIGTGSNVCGSSLSADSSCLIYVTFKPSTTAAESATLNVADNASGSPQTSALTGTGVTPAAPVAALSPSIAFGSEPLGSTTAAMSATLSNTGNATLNITGTTITGANASDFAAATASNACGSSLAAGSTCMIYVTFKPSTAAAESATLNVADNATGSPQTSALTGTGTATEGGFAVKSPTAPQSVQLGGSAQFTINVSPNPQGDFFNNAVALSASGLPPGATASFSPSSVTPGSSTVPSTMTVQVPSMIGELRAPPSPGRWPILPTSLALGFGGAWAVFRRRRRTRLDRWLSLLLLAVTLAAASLGITSCGGGFALFQPTSYTITVTGTSGSQTQTTTVQLTVQ